MIYTLPKVPKACQPLSDLSKAFNNFSTHPEVAQRVMMISSLRSTFYQNIEGIDKAGLNQMIRDFDHNPLFEYLNYGPDLLEMAVKNANFPFNFSYTSVLSPSKVCTVNDGRSGLSRQ
jgi:hypothetical protein